MPAPAGGIPAPPNSGTQDTNPQLTYAQYLLDTHDGDPPLTGGAFESYSADALLVLQERTNRTLVYGQYTERLYLYQDGIVYPSAAPFDETKGVSVGPEANTDDSTIFQGYGIWVGWYIPLATLPVWTGVVPPQTDVTYWGGYSSPVTASPPGPIMPPDLRRALSRMVWFLAHPVALQGMAPGIKSMSVGGVSVAGDLSSFVDTDRDLRRIVRLHKRRLARAWQS